MPDSLPSNRTSCPLRVMLVDDNRLMLEGLENLLAAHGIEVLGTASDGLEAITLAYELHPDLILMDIRMPRCDGLEATRHIKARMPDIKIVMLTTSAEEADLFESVKSGAIGYLIKSMSGDDFIQALRGLEQGVPPFSPGLAARLLREFARMAEDEERNAGEETAQDLEQSKLTKRQAEVLQLVASGLTYKEVGNRLALSERTVRYHMVEIMDRLHLEHRSQVIAYVGKLGLEGKEEN
jgi:DNA-binding NarL/FixJ family response regulator